MSSPGPYDDPPSTEDLVDQASQGDPVAVDALLVRFLPGLRAYVRLRAGPMIRARESASDLVQSVCREVLEHKDQLRYGGEAGFKHWLYTTAFRKIANRKEYYQAAKRDVRRERPAKPNADDSAGDILSGYGTLTTPSKFAIAHEQVERLEAAFDRLSEEHREVILLARMIGHSRAEIARITGRTEGAVRSMLSRALAQLAGHLDTE